LRSHWICRGKNGRKEARIKEAREGRMEEGGKERRERGRERNKKRKNKRKNQRKKERIKEKKVRFKVLENIFISSIP
jgi:hypothetical protein